MSETDRPSQAAIELDHQITITTGLSDADFLIHCAKLAKEGQGELVPALQTARLARQAFSEPVTPHPEAVKNGREKLMDAVEAKNQQTRNDKQ